MALMLMSVSDEHFIHKGEGYEDRGNDDNISQVEYLKNNLYAPSK